MSGLSRSEYIKTIVEKYVNNDSVVEASVRSESYKDKDFPEDGGDYPAGLEDGKILGKEELALEILKLWE